MKNLIGLGVIASLCACVADVPDSGVEVQEIRDRCPDETCPQSNGGGVYTEEFGIATVGGDHSMIRNFVNNGSSVETNLRDWDDNLGDWEVSHPELIDVVLDNNYTTTYNLVSISETLSTPTFTLKHNNGAPFTVTGTQLVDRRLTLRYKGESSFAIGFASQTSEVGRDTTLQEYFLEWAYGDQVTFGAATPYCMRAKNAHGVREPDPVMFQAGIFVNVTNAKVNFAANSVTLSCRHGAVATAKYWGYKYRGSQGDLDEFEAAMHMKRASYCGDDAYYTKRGIHIWISDPDGYQNANQLGTNIEAQWGPDGTGQIRATCVNMLHRRLGGAEYPLGSGNTFSPTCNGTPIPACPTTHNKLTDWYAYTDDN